MDQYMNVCVGKDVAQLAAGIERIAGHGLGTGGMDGEHRNAYVQRVAEHDADPFIACAQRHQFVGEPGHAAQVLRIAEALALAHQRFALGHLLRRRDQHMHHGRMDLGQITHELLRYAP